MKPCCYPGCTRPATLAPELIAGTVEGGQVQMFLDWRICKHHVDATTAGVVIFRDLVDERQWGEINHQIAQYGWPMLDIDSRILAFWQEN